MTGDAKRLCNSCDACQRKIPKGKTGKAPQGKAPLISTPFHKVAIYLVGPMTPVSS